MKNKFLTLFTLSSVLTFFGSCNTLAPAMKTNLPSTNKDVKVELLFEIDGCKVYRFNDNKSEQTEIFYKMCLHKYC